MEVASASKASVTVYKSTWHPIPDNCSFFKDACENSNLVKCMKLVVFMVSKCKQFF